MMSATMPEPTEEAPAPAFASDTVLLDLFVEANNAHAQAELGARAAVDAAIRSGEFLAKAKARAPHGQFERLVREHTNISPQTARRYMQIARNRSRMSDFDGGIVEALDLLRADKAPPAAAGELDLGAAPSAPAPVDAPRETPDDSPPPPAGAAQDAENPVEAVSSPAEPAAPAHGDSEAPSGDRLAPLMSSASDEWYTPAHVWEFALDALQRDVFDVDPCAEAPNPHRPGVAADRHYRIEDDGLGAEWHGVVWMNPPYSAIGEWIAKLAEECAAGRCTDFAVLVPARTDTGWWRQLTAGHDQTVVFLHGRLKFDAPEGSTTSAPFPSALVFGCTDPDDVLAALPADFGAAYRKL